MLRLLGRGVARTQIASRMVLAARLESTLAKRVASSGLDLKQKRDSLSVLELPDEGPCGNCATHVQHVARLWTCHSCGVVRCPSCHVPTSNACPGCGAPDVVLGRASRLAPVWSYGHAHGRC